MGGGCDDEPMGADSFVVLQTPAGQELLKQAALHYDPADELGSADSVRRGSGTIPAHVVSEALTQVRLRRLAGSTFGGELAARLYFTDEGLQQATSRPIAVRRAQRAATLVPGGWLVDLGCGIGADLMAFAEAGLAVVGVDRDPYAAAVAAANLRALGLPGSVATALAETVRLAAAQVVFVDPARRLADRRVLDPRRFSPPWSFVESLLRLPGEQGRRARLAVVKTAPGLDHALIPDGVEAEWVSLRGELKETALWSPAPGRGRRTAVVLDGAGGETRVDDAGGRPSDPDVRAPGGFLYEPDPAVIRAGLVAAVCERVDGWLLDPHLAYVSADAHNATGLATAYRVIDVLPFRERALRAALRDRGVGPLTIKKRGVSVDPAVLRRRLGLRGDVPATIVLTRTPRSAMALLVERIP